MTATLADSDFLKRERTVFGEQNVFLGGWPIEKHGRCAIPAGPAHVLIGGEHYRYEQYQALTLWGLQKMSRREIRTWKIKRLLRRPI